MGQILLTLFLTQKIANNWDNLEEEVEKTGRMDKAIDFYVDTHRSSNRNASPCTESPLCFATKSHIARENIIWLSLRDRFVSPQRDGLHGHRHGAYVTVDKNFDFAGYAFSLYICRQNIF